MMRCKHCEINVSGERERCPLCHSELTREGAKSPDIFPFIPTVYHQHSFIFKIMLFASVVLVIAAAAINLIFIETGPWAMFVLGGVLCVWLSIFLAIQKRKNIPKGLLYQVVFISAVSVIWDLLTGFEKWSIDYVIPILCASMMVAMPLLSLFLKWGIENIITYFAINILFGIVPIIFYFTGILNVIIPSILCVACSLVSVAALAIFKGESIWAELRRRLYM